MSDHVAVFNNGRIEQIGSPAEVYDRPATAFVADFVGTSNILHRNGSLVCIRPERIAFADSGVAATIADVTFVGAFTRYSATTDGGEELLVVRQADGSPLARGAKVHLAWKDEDAFTINHRQEEAR